MYSPILILSRNGQGDITSNAEARRRNCSQNQAVHDRIMEEIEQGNNNFGKWETIKKVELTPEIWSVDNNLLTPTFKPKREVILKRYKHFIQDLNLNWRNKA